MSHHMYSAIYRLSDASSTISFQWMDDDVIIADDVSRYGYMFSSTVDIWLHALFQL
jgi:hypothetical protein